MKTDRAGHSTPTLSGQDGESRWTFSVMVDGMMYVADCGEDGDGEGEVMTRVQAREVWTDLLACGYVRTA